MCISLKRKVFYSTSESKYLLKPPKSNFFFLTYMSIIKFAHFMKIIVSLQ